MKFKGKVWKFGNDVNTDEIISGKYKYDTLNINEIVKHTFEVIDPDFAEKVSKGDIIVAGGNFGCGSSREQAPLVIKQLGISTVIADFFARIFYRNAVNTGLPIIECPLSEKVDEGDILDVDFEEGSIKNLSKNESFEFKKLPMFMLDILEAGGLVNYLREKKGFPLK